MKVKILKYFFDVKLGDMQPGMIIDMQDDRTSNLIYDGYIEPYIGTEIVTEDIKKEDTKDTKVKRKK